MWLHLRSALIWLALLLPLGASAQEPNPSNGSQSVEPASGTSTFYAESRQVLIEATVWKGSEANGTAHVSLLPEGPPARPQSGRAGAPQLPKWWPAPARGLTVKDFRVFDNGVEQKINFLKETDFSTSNLPDHLSTGPDEHGTWASLEPNEFQDARATYLIGYAPASLQSGECRSIQVSVKGHDVDLNRTQYCGPDAPDDHVDRTSEARSLEKQMQSFSNSEARESVKVSVQAFAFWSSGVLHLLTEASSNDKLSGQVPFTYVVEVHDSKALASVEIAAEFHLPSKYWSTSDCRKENRAVHILGMVYTTTGELATEFADSAPCLNPHVMNSTPMKYALKHSLLPAYVAIPTRFDTQVELPAGEYELRIIVSDGKNFGRARLPFHVEHFANKRLNLSDIVLAGIVRDSSWVLLDAASVAPLPVVPTPLVSKNLQFLPDVDPNLQGKASLTLYFEIYEPLVQTQIPAVYYQLRITDLKTGSLVLNTGPMSAAKWLIPQNTVIPVGLKIDTGKLKKGSYRLEVQSSDSAGRKSGWRQAIFTIE